MESLRIAITADIKINKTISQRIIPTFFFSLTSLLEAGTNTSSAKVEAEVKTNEERVDIEADNTSTITIPIM